MEKETDLKKTAIVRDVFIIVAASFLILDNILLIALAIVTW
ncbi:unknown [Bacteroides sp. CAG:545]|nr:unknown [Bacteroides sp. CAG:545]